MKTDNHEPLDVAPTTKGPLAPDPTIELIEAALYHLTDASIALRCIVGPIEPIAQATARDLDRYASAIERIAG